MAGAGNASLEVLWNLTVSPVEVNAMEMVFLAEFEVVVNHDLRIPFRVNLLEQLFRHVFLSVARVCRN